MIWSSWTGLFPRHLPRPFLPWGHAAGDIRIEEEIAGGKRLKSLKEREKVKSWFSSRETYPPIIQLRNKLLYTFWIHYIRFRASLATVIAVEFWPVFVACVESPRLADCRKWTGGFPCFHAFNYSMCPTLPPQIVEMRGFTERRCYSSTGGCTWIIGFCDFFTFMGATKEILTVHQR